MLLGRSLLVWIRLIMSQIDKCFKYFTSQPDRGPEPRWSVVEERHQPVYRSDQVIISRTYSWRWWWYYVLVIWDDQQLLTLREEFVSTYASGKIASRAPRQPVNYENHQVDHHDNHDHYDLTSSPVFVNYENHQVNHHRPWLGPKTITIITIHLFGHHGHHHKLNLIVSSGHVCNMFLSL